MNHLRALILRSRSALSTTAIESGLRQTSRPFRSSPSQTRMASSQSAVREAKDWSADQYLKFAGERTRPSYDLLAQVPLTSPRRVVDLGCGPGNSTAVLAARYPDAHLRGMDSSPDMVRTAQTTLPDVPFELGDLSTYTPDEPADLLFSNAVFQWLPVQDRIPIIRRLIQTQPAGGVFAFQVPDNFTEPSHAAMRDTAANGGPWTAVLKDRPQALAKFQSPQELYDQLKPLCSTLNIWHTHYYHILDNHEAVVEWVKGTGLRPFVDPLSAEDRQGFLDAYLARIKEVYPASFDGKVILKYPRLFVVAVKA